MGRIFRPAIVYSTNRPKHSTPLLAPIAFHSEAVWFIFKNIGAARQLFGYSVDLEVELWFSKGIGPDEFELRDALQQFDD